MADPISPHGSVIIEEVILGVIRKGLDEIKQNPSIIDDIIKGLPVDVEGEILEKTKTWIQEDRDISVRYPYSGQSVYPAIIVSPMGEEEVLDPVGEEIDQEFFPEDEQWLTYNGSLWQHRHDISIWTVNPFRTIILYYIVRHVLAAQRIFMQDCGLTEIEFSGGPLRGDTTTAPDKMFIRDLTMSSKSYVVHVDRDTAIGKITVEPNPEEDC